MGQTYVIDLTVRFTDEKEVLRLAQDFRTKKAHAKDPGARADIRPFEDTDGLMRSLFTENVACDEPGHYTSDFDASYGWEGVMTEAFQAIAPALADGSRLEIYPDAGMHTLLKQDGRVWHSYEENVEL